MTTRKLITDPILKDLLLKHIQFRLDFWMPEPERQAEALTARHNEINLITLDDKTYYQIIVSWLKFHVYMDGRVDG